MRNRPVLEIACNLVHEHKVVTGYEPHQLGVHHSDIQPMRGKAVQLRTRLIAEFSEELKMAAERRPEWMEKEEFYRRYAGAYAEYIIENNLA